jgi:hypothetical protein
MKSPDDLLAFMIKDLHLDNATANSILMSNISLLQVNDQYQLFHSPHV